jgi:hypothetical protein
MQHTSAGESKAIAMYSLSGTLLEVVRAYIEICSAGCCCKVCAQLTSCTAVKTLLYGAALLLKELKIAC